MKFLALAVLASLIASSAIAAPAGWSRPGGYYEYAHNTKSMVTSSRDFSCPVGFTAGTGWHVCNAI